MNNVISMHPKAQAAFALARERSALRQLEKEQLKNAIATHGIHFYAVGNYTLCYRVDRHNVIELSTAMRNPADKPDPHIGRVEAFARFAKNNRIHMKVPSAAPSVRSFLKEVFDPIVYF